MSRPERENERRGELLDAALGYAAEGWPVLRLRAGAKTPAEAHGLRDATLDAEEIARRFAGWPGNLGAVVPAGVLVVDVDTDAALAALAARGVSLPATAKQRTPRGFHYVYTMPAGVEARQTAGELAPGVDTRAGGRGYIVVEPSRVGGVGYQWETPLRRELIAEAPAELLAALAAPSASPSAPRSNLLPFARRGAPPVDPMRLLLEGAPAGSRNVEIFRGCCALRREGGSAEALLRFAMLVNARCSPPLDPREVERIAASAARYPAGAGEAVAR